jgi:hypothetical protein
MTPRLPGLPTMSALMLAATIAAALGIWGPFDVSKIKEWQTLLAACIAIAAAVIAYLAAKVNFERSLHEGEKSRRSQNILIKVRYAAVILRTNIAATRNRLQPAAVFGTTTDILVKDIWIRWPPEFQEAWEHLDVFKPGAVEMIVNIKYNLDLFDEALARLDPNKAYRYDWAHTPEEIKAVIKLMKEIDTFIEDLLKAL